MAFGFVPRYSRKETIENSPSEILLFAVESAKTLNWNIGHVSKNRIVAYTSFSMGSWSEQINISIADHELTIKSECSGNQIFDWGKNKKNVEEFFAGFYEFRASLSPEELDLRQRALEVTDESDTSIHQFETSQGKITSFFSIFIPTEGYLVTPIIVNLNILMFVLMALTGVNVMMPDIESMLAWGANYRSMTLEGQWWRLLTSCFLHFGIIHLLFNMYALVYIGLILELRMGSVRFLAAYLLTGIASSIASLYWNDLTVSAGASGAIFGMYGVFLAMLTTNLIDKAARQAFLTSIIVFVVYNLLGGLRDNNIDNSAHIGGLLSGLLMGYTFYPSMKRPAENSVKYGVIGVMTMAVIASGFWVFSHVSNDVGIYEKKMQEFITLEERALSIYGMENVADSIIMNEINDVGLPAWGQCLRLVIEADQLSIPEPLHQRNYQLKTYCNLRIKAYELMAKSIQENNEGYLSQIEDYNRQIEVVVEQMTRDMEQR